MNDIIVIIFISLGTLFVLLAAIGLLRMPDLFLRISVTTKAATLGVGLILIGMAVHFWKTSITTEAIAIIVFLLLTAPIGAHLIGRASYFVGVPLWKKSLLNDLKGKYNRETHQLNSSESKEKGQENSSEDTEEPLDLD